MQGSPDDRDAIDPLPRLTVKVFVAGSMPSAQSCAPCSTSCDEKMPFENSVERSHMPRADGASKPPTTFELVPSRERQRVTAHRVVGAGARSEVQQLTHAGVDALAVFVGEEVRDALVRERRELVVGRRAGGGGNATASWNAAIASRSVSVSVPGRFAPSGPFWPSPTSQPSGVLCWHIGPESAAFTR